MTGSTNNSSTSLHTMSPLNSSSQNLTASNASGGSPMRRVPPALPGLPSRPSRSGSKSAVPTLDKVDEKVRPSVPAIPAEKAVDSGESREDMPRGSGVARLIAEANRRAQETGAANAKSVPASSTEPSTANGANQQNQTPALSRSVPALPARSVSVPANENLKNSVPNLASISVERAPALPLPPRRDSNQSRKGSLNVGTRGTPPSQPVPSTIAPARSASGDSGKLRRLPPPVAGHSAMKETSVTGTNLVDATTEGSSGAKKPKPSVPPKPRNLM
jgi:hypothetical protein